MIVFRDDEVDQLHEQINMYEMEMENLRQQVNTLYSDFWL